MQPHQGGMEREAAPGSGGPLSDHIPPSHWWGPLQAAAEAMDEFPGS